jgi:6-phosphogluconolactonase (cycloisomerase 2 family)
VGRFLYFVSAANGSIASFRIDGASGALGSIGERVLTGGARALTSVMDPSGRFLYVARSGGRGGIDVFSIDPSSGALQAVTGSPFDLDRQSDSLSVHPAGRFLLSTRTFNFLIDTFAIDGQSGGLGGSAVQSLSLSVAPTAPVLRPDGRFLYFARGDLGEVRTASFDSASGRLTVSAFMAVPDLVRSLSVDPRGSFLYVTTATPFSSDTLFLYRVDTGTGLPTRVPGAPFAAGFDAAASNFRPDRVTFDPTGRFAYVLDRAGRTGARSRGIFVFPVQSSGLLGPTFLGPFSTPPTEPFLIGDNAAFALDPSGRFAYLTDATSNSISVFLVDATTGAMTVVGTPTPLPSGFGTIVIAP